MPLRAKKLKLTNQHKPIRNLTRIHVSDSEPSEESDWEDYIPTSMRIAPFAEDMPMEELPFKLKKEYPFDPRCKRNLGEKQPYPDINPAGHLPSPPEHLQYAKDRHAMLVGACTYLNDAFTLSLDELREGTYKIGAGNTCRYKIHKKEFRGAPSCPDLLATVVVSSDYDIQVIFNLPVELEDGTIVETYPHIPNTAVRFNAIGTPIIMLFNEHNQFKVHDFSRNSYTRHVMADPLNLIYKYDPRYKAIDTRFEKDKKNVIQFRLLRNEFTIPLGYDLTPENPKIKIYYTCESSMQQFVADYRYVECHLIDGEIVVDFNYSECAKWTGLRRDNSSINYLKISIKAGPHHKYY
ncbi:hypothetical protein HK103_000821 [Boothiomyces macroporosus]|uniref:Uncharacterized protein n=1 Tax=Boothiomyces macroporosus TaxID=261099 RepID=A0AAD5UEV2_9FUNG|nr:hypothetical protein HK103_000821 [Boothiomyces macroporosus]